MATTQAVKRALAALATRTDTARSPYAAVIEEATDARADLSRAAGFLDAVGLDRLEAATTAAADAEEAALADRGREALRAYRRLRAAAAGDRPRPPDAVRDAPDHFRRGGGTPKCGTGQPHAE
ncbi:hypothetical protein [Haloparvum sedimenti]|uniref:hypothetical protein n=1 Tax=Haloparvum sedimenti TaxID=1678448 RepID=UPI00071E6FCC|nr:hypothetical protein [Haloparvum sedimenti]